MFFPLLVIVKVVDFKYVGTIETKDNAPVATNIYGVKATVIASQLMEAESGQVHVFRLLRGIKASQNQSDPDRMFWLDADFNAGLEVPLQAFVPEGLDHGEL
jgi:hypothetical protein